MKKLLLSTTALIGAFAVATTASADEGNSVPPLTVTLGGSVQFTAGYLSEDEAGPNAPLTSGREYATQIDADAFINGEGTAANGIVYGGKVQLLPEQNDFEAHDEYFLYASGELGTIEAGLVGGAASRLNVAAPADFATGGAFGEYEEYVLSGATVGGISLDQGFDGRDQLAATEQAYEAFDSHDAAKITYFSPRFSGFQFGASFAPDGTTNSAVTRNDDILAANIGAATTTGVLSRQDFENFYEIGLNYAAEFGGVGLAVSGGYVGADAKDNVTTAASYEDLVSWAAGAQLSYLGFTLGGGYTYSGDSGYLEGGANDDEAQAYNFGLQYAAGPFIVGGNALVSESEGRADNPNNNETVAYSFGTSYVAAPGWTAFLETTVYEIETDAGLATATGGNYSNDGAVILVGSSIEF